jgi:hypothetical protein
MGLVAWMALVATWIVFSPGLQIAFGTIGGLIIALALEDLFHLDHALGASKRSQGEW